MTKLTCNGCGYEPHNLGEYIDAAKEYGISPAEYVKQEEGTYNATNGHFYCTSCYCEAGMPLGVAP